MGTDSRLVRLGFLVRKTYKDQFASIVSAIERRTRAVDDLASALTQETLKQHIDG